MKYIDFKINFLLNSYITDAHQAGIPAVIKEWLLNTIGSFNTCDIENYLI